MVFLVGAIMKLRKTLTRLLTFLSAVMLVSACASGGLEIREISVAELAAKNSRPSRPLLSREKSAIAEAIKGSMKDPVSARFTWYPLVTTIHKGKYIYCGLVNGKNSFGGYVGKVPFMVTLEPSGKQAIAQNVAIAPGGYNSDRLDVLRWCARSGYALDYTDSLLFYGDQIPPEYL